jgi:hypothetical protein
VVGVDEICRGLLLFQVSLVVQEEVDMDIQAMLLMVLVMETFLQEHLELKHHQMAFLDLEIQAVLVLLLRQEQEEAEEVQVVLEALPQIQAQEVLVA